MKRISRRTIHASRFLGVLTCVALVITPLVGAGADVASATTRRAPKRVAKSFTISLPRDSRTVTAGSTAVYPFTFKRTGGFKGVVEWDVLDVPSEITARIVTRSTTRYEVQMSVSASAPAGSRVYFLEGRSDSIRKTVPFRLTVNSSVTSTLGTTSTTSAAAVPVVPTGDFLLTPQTQTRTVSPGETTTYAVRVDRRALTGPVALKLEGLPEGARASFNPNPSQTNTDLTVYVAPGTLSGTYLLIISGNSSGITRLAAVRLVVRRAGPFLLSATPAVLTTTAGNDAVTNITVGVPAGATILPDVTVELLGAPAGVVVQTPTIDGRNTRFVLATSPDTPAGVYRLTAVGRSGTFTQNLVLTLTVTRESQGFGLSAQPSVATVKQGSPAAYEVKLVAIGGFSGQVAFSLAGLPATAASSIETTATGVTVRINTTPSTAATTYPLLITGKSGGLAATIAVSLVVVAAAS